MVKKIELNDIPEILERCCSLMDREIRALYAKDSLTSEEHRALVALTTTLSNTYKDYRQEIKAIREELKGKSRMDILEMIETDPANPPYKSINRG